MSVRPKQRNTLRVGRGWTLSHAHRSRIWVCYQGKAKLCFTNYLPKCNLTPDAQVESAKHLAELWLRPSSQHHWHQLPSRPSACVQPDSPAALQQSRAAQGLTAHNIYPAPFLLGYRALCQYGCTVFSKLLNKLKDKLACRIMVTPGTAKQMWPLCLWPKSIPFSGDSAFRH